MSDVTVENIVDDFFEVYRTEPEVIFPIPVTAKDQLPMQIAIGKMGGGHIDAEYPGNWIYAIYVKDMPIYSGTDLRSGTPITHTQAAGLLVDVLLNREESDQHEENILKAHGGRLEYWLTESFEQEA